MVKKFKELQAKMSSETRAASERKAALYSQEMALDELKTAHGGDNPARLEEPQRKPI